VEECNMTRQVCKHKSGILGIRNVHFLALLCLIMIWGCGPEIKVPPLTLTDAARMQAAASYAMENYRIEPGDTIQIRYTFHPEMNQEEVVKPDGKISVVMVGEMSVSGLTTAEVAKVLVEKTSNNLRDPEIVVDITRYSDKTV
jgi:protein involved in polysaccharide export with SLBB domain